MSPATDDSPAAEETRRWLARAGVDDLDRGARDLRDIARRGLDDRAHAELIARLGRLLPACPDPGLALTQLDRFLAAGGLAAPLLADPRAAEVAVRILGSSPFLGEILIGDPPLLGWLRDGPDRRDAATLVEELWAELTAAEGDDARRDALRGFRRREMLRIGYNDIVRELPLDVTSEDLSHLAEACVEAARRIAEGHALRRHGTPIGPEGLPSKFVVLALGKLGGEELNYSSDIDLIFLYDEEGQTDGPRSVSNAEHFARLGGEVVRILADPAALGAAYRVDMRLRPEGGQGALARSLAATLGYYETSGRTWERQALIKCRPIAGDASLGRRFLEAIEPFVYRRYLGGAEIGEIKAMKRRIEARTRVQGAEEVEVKTGRGGIRDVEFVVQFLQLLHGGSMPEVRHPNTLVAMSRLEDARCLTSEERGIMEDTYRFLRQVEHRLQALHDRQTHEMPRDPEALRALAVRIGYAPEPGEPREAPAVAFLADYRAKTDLNRQILNHLLHDAFREDDDSPVDPVVDLVLDPEPSAELIAQALGPYPFRDHAVAYRNLMALAREEIEFLSTARCRHFLAAIAPRLLKAVGRAPDPDRALTNLEKVSASLGAKAILWELFSFNPPTLRLFVEVCSSSQFLSEILINNPGMIDDLMDSLVLDRPQPPSAIRAELAELCRGAEDLHPILHGFRNKEWVRIGTRDILGREPVRDVTRELADVAEANVGQVARDQWRRQVDRQGVPRGPDGRRTRWAIVGLGKLGGRELNYHSDLDLAFVYDGDGGASGRRGAVGNDEYFAELGRRILKALAGRVGVGHLYKADARLRPHGASGPLAVSLDGLKTYFQHHAQTWERLAWTRARVVASGAGFGREVDEAVRGMLARPVDAACAAREVVAMRRRLEESCPAHDLKRRSGGIADVEFLAQYLMLIHASAAPALIRPNIWDAIGGLWRAGKIDARTHDDLCETYDFWRTVEGRLRLVQNRSGAELPEDEGELARLALHLHYDPRPPVELVSQFRADAARQGAEARALFQRFVG